MAGLHLDPWQQFVLTNSLGERADGKWAAFEVGVMVSRQNGKGGLLEARELAGLFLLGERLIVHSAHQFDTSLEAFGRLLALIDDHKEFRRRVKRVSNAHGQEGLTLTTGQRIRFRTRTKGGGRGFTGDCLILDEAMDIPEAKLSSLLPTLSARPNPQIWYTGSAVDQQDHDNGIVFARIRERGHAGNDPRLAYFEWSADAKIEEVTHDFTANPANWALANPALGIRITTEFVEAERAAFGAARGFAVERLGVGDWPRTDDAAQRMISHDQWVSLEDSESQAKDPVSFAFDITPDRSVSTIAVAGDRSDGRPHVEIIEHRRGTGWVVDRLKSLVESHKTWEVLCDPYGPAGSLMDEVEAVVGHRANGDSRLTAVTAKEHAQACGTFFDSVIDSRLRHLGTSELEAAVDGASTRQLGDAWAWDRKTSGTDISPLVAVTLANWGNYRRPRGKPGVVNLNALD